MTTGSGAVFEDSITGIPMLRIWPGGLTPRGAPPFRHVHVPFCRRFVPIVHCLHDAEG